MSDRQPDADTRAYRTATAGEPKPTNSEANRRWRVIEHVGTTDHRETDGRILAAILTDQGRLGCGLKPADGDMDRILSGVINSDGTIGGREFRPGTSRQGQQS